MESRAYENMLCVATCNYPDTVPDCNGCSSVFDGIAYLPDQQESRDTCLLKATSEEGLFIAQINLEELRRYRKTEVHGNAYRHPEKYKMLLDTQIDEPFIRNDYRK